MLVTLSADTRLFDLAASGRSSHTQSEVQPSSARQRPSTPNTTVGSLPPTASAEDDILQVLGVTDHAFEVRYG